MQNILVRAPWTGQLGLPFSHLGSLGSLLVTFAEAQDSLPLKVLQTGDAITTANEIFLEPSGWEEAQVQLRNTLAQVTSFRKLRFLRAIVVPNAIMRNTRKHTVPSDASGQHEVMKIKQRGFKPTHSAHRQEIKYFAPPAPYLLFIHGKGD